MKLLLFIPKFASVVSGFKSKLAAKLQAARANDLPQKLIHP